MKLYDPSLPSSKKAPQARYLSDLALLIEPESVMNGYYPVIETGDKDLISVLQGKGFKEVIEAKTVAPKPSAKPADTKPTDAK